jgi:hypothetical protein
MRKWSQLTIAVLTNLGEKMTDDEVDELLKAVDTSSGEINYTGWSFSFCCAWYYWSLVDADICILNRSRPYNPC